MKDVPFSAETPRTLRSMRFAAALFATAVIAGCGGGTSGSEPSNKDSSVDTSDSRDHAAGPITGDSSRAPTGNVVADSDNRGADPLPPATSEVPPSDAPQDAGTNPAAPDTGETPSDDPPPQADQGDLAQIITTMPEGGWSKVNRNDFSDVWTPKDLRPLLDAGTPDPSRTISAWSSFAWDSKGGNLIIYGGGHSNSNSNDVYIWRGATRKWERGSLPSEVKQDPVGNTIAIDGTDNAPASAHTYDNNIYLPILDRFLTFGGAAPQGDAYMRQDTATTKRKTGPYVFDPSRAHPNKVGGTTGSHVKRGGPHPEIVGGNMWSNRDNYINPDSRPPNENFVEGCTAYAEEDGKDVIYVRTGYAVYRYKINDLSNSTLDTWEKVGIYWGGPGSKSSCGYDPLGKSFVRTATSAAAFSYWNLNTPGNNNREAAFTPADATGEFQELLSSKSIIMSECGLDFDQQRRQYALWCDDGRVWMLKPPNTLSAQGWTISKQPAPVGAVPSTRSQYGVLGKWEYAPDLDVFVGLQDPVRGNVWIYKPVGWSGLRR